jgi:hypothetical protein
MRVSAGNSTAVLRCNTPVPNDNEVLIKINSVSLNAADYRSMKMGLILRWRDFVNRASAQRLKKIKVEFFVCNKKYRLQIGTSGVS